MVSWYENLFKVQQTILPPLKHTLHDRGVAYLSFGTKSVNKKAAEFGSPRLTCEDMKFFGLDSLEKKNMENKEDQTENAH